MLIKPDDPRLTAYALNELSERERRAVEAFLASSAEARATVEEIRATAALLTDGLRAEPALTFTDAQREELESRLTSNPSPVPVRLSRPMKLFLGASSAAASVTLLVAAGWWLMPSFSRAREIAPPNSISNLGGIGRGFSVYNDSASFQRTPPTADLTDAIATTLGDAHPSPATLPSPTVLDGHFTFLATEATGLVLTGGDALSVQVGNRQAFSSKYHDRQCTGTLYLDDSFHFDNQPNLSYGYQLPYQVRDATSLHPRQSLEPDHQPGGGASPSAQVVQATGFGGAGGGCLRFFFTNSADGSGLATGDPFADLGGNGTDPTDYTLEDVAPTIGDKPSLGEWWEPTSYADIPVAGYAQVGGQPTIDPSSGEFLYSWVQFDGGATDTPKIQGINLAFDLASSESDVGIYHEWEGDGISELVPNTIPWCEVESGEWFPHARHEESYAPITDNAFLSALSDPLSTFSIDVDTASYSNIRRFLMQGALPPGDAVRVEELLNYFEYGYEPPEDDGPFSAEVEVATCPWNPANRLARIGLKGRIVDLADRPPSNLVFLIDVSGSMQAASKLPLVQSGLRELVTQLDERDRIAIVTYAGDSRLALAPTTAATHDAILAVIDGLQAEGSTNGASGIELAYRIAAENFICGGTNRVILCTDGDFNVGVSDDESLVQIIRDKARTGVFLSVLGFGMGNLKDSKLEKLADKGNGRYAYIDSFDEARKVLVDEVGGTLLTIAKDVKIQVEFNPATVAAYRLIGYENRTLAARDFNDDTKDAGEIGSGHTVTALYELVPALPDTPPVLADLPEAPDIDPLKYQTPPQLLAAATRPADCLELLTIKLRYKLPEEDFSQLIEFAAYDDQALFDESSDDFRFAAAVAEFGMLLRESPYRADSSLDAVIETAATALGDDPNGRRAEFVELVKRAKALSTSR